MLAERYETYSQVLTRLNSDLSRLWAATVAHVIASERAAMLADLAGLRRLHDVVASSNEMLRNSKTADAVYSQIARQVERVVPTIYVIQADRWYKSNEADLQELLHVASGHASPASVVAWLRRCGPSVEARLDRDRARVERLCKEAPTSAVWHGIALVDEVRSGGAIRLQPPSVHESFFSETRRVYAVDFFSDSEMMDIVRAIPSVRVLYVVHQCVARGWLRFDVVSHAFALKLIKYQRDTCNDRINELTREIRSVLSAHGESQAEADVLELVIRHLHAQRDGMPVNAPSCIDTVRRTPDAKLNGERLPSAQYLRAQAYVDNALFAPRLPTVPRCSQVEYAVVCAVADRMLELQRRDDDDTAEYSAQKIGASAREMLENSYGMCGAKTKRVLESDNSLAQTVGSVLRRLVAACKAGMALAHKYDATVPETFAGFSPLRTHNRKLRLCFPNGKRNPTAGVFLEACARVKASLDENIPLPCGMLWRAQ